MRAIVLRASRTSAGLAVVADPGGMPSGRLVVAGEPPLPLGPAAAPRGLARDVGRAQPEVLLDAARQLAHLAVAEQGQLLVGHALEEVAVVGDDDEGARPAVEDVLERGQRLDVEVVGRLVEDEDVRLGHAAAASAAAGAARHR